MQPIKQFVFYSITSYALYFAGVSLCAQPKPTTLVSSFAPAIKNLNPQHKKCALLLGINDGAEYQTVLLSFDPKIQKIEQTANLPLLASPQGKQFHFIYSLLTDTLYNEQRTQTVATTKIKKQTTVTNWWHKTQTVLYLSNNRKYLADIIAQINKNRQPQANKALPDCSSCTYLEANDIQTINYIIPKYANFLHQKTGIYANGDDYFTQTEQTIRLSPPSGPNFKGVFNRKNKTHRNAIYDDFEAYITDACKDDLQRIFTWKTTTGMFADYSYGFKEAVIPETENTDIAELYIKYLQLDTAKAEKMLPTNAKRLLKAHRMKESAAKQRLTDSLANTYLPYIPDTDNIEWLLYRYEGRIHLIAQCKAYPMPQYRKKNAPTYLLQHDVGAVLPNYSDFPLQFADFTKINPMVVDVTVSPTHDLVFVYLADGTLIGINVTSKREIYRQKLSETDKVVMLEWATGIYTDIWKNELKIK